MVRYQLYNDYASIKTEWGYFAEIFIDGEVHQFDICEECYAKWLSTFKYAPTGFGKSFFDKDYLWEDDKVEINEQEEFEEWKENFRIE